MRFATNAGTTQDIENWLNSFEESELLQQGWTTQDLLQTYNSYPHMIAYTDEGLASVLMFQMLDNNHFDVLFLGTSPQFRRKGYQEGLLLHFFKANPEAELWLECRADNHAALALYNKCGFRESGRRSRYYKDGMDAILMGFSGSQGPV